MSILRQSLRLNAVQSSLIQTMILSVYLWIIVLFLVFLHCPFNTVLIRRLHMRNEHEGQCARYLASHNS